MHFVKLVAVFVACVLTFAVAHRFVAVTPLLQPVVNVVLVRLNQAALRNRLLNQRFDCPLFNILEHLQNKTA